MNNGINNIKEAIQGKLRQLDKNQEAKLPRGCDPRSAEWRRIMMDEDYLRERRKLVSQLIDDKD